MPASTKANLSTESTTFEVPLQSGVVDTSNALTVDQVLNGVSSRHRLRTPAANTTNVTSRHLFSVVLPQTYVPGTSLTVELSAHLSGATNNTSTIDLEAFLANPDGTASGSDLCSTSAASINTTNQQLSFTVGSTGLTRGSLLFLVVTFAVNDSGGSAGNKYGYLTRVRLTGTLNAGIPA